jgi:hypothetical protein
MDTQWPPSQLAGRIPGRFVTGQAIMKASFDPMILKRHLFLKTTHGGLMISIRFCIIDFPLPNSYFWKEMLTNGLIPWFLIQRVRLWGIPIFIVLNTRG